MMTKQLKCLLILALVLMLASCTGWRLRGSDTSSLQSNSIYLSGDSGTVYGLVRERLTRKQALTILTNASIQLLIEREELKRRTVSVNRNALTEEYELVLTVNYRIANIEGKDLVAPREARVVRSYTFDQNDIAGKDKEEAIIKRDMYNAAARQILQQVEFIQRR